MAVFEAFFWTLTRKKFGEDPKRIWLELLEKKPVNAGVSYELKGLSLVSWESYPQLKGEAKGQTALWTAGEVSLPLLVWKYPTEIRR